VLFIQGGGPGVHDEWDNKLVASLKRELGPRYDVLYPRMPNEADPSYAVWAPALAAEIAALDDCAVLVGHSIGATILINALATVPMEATFSGILLIAPPYVGDGGWPSDEIADMVDLGRRPATTAPIFIYRGSDDDTVPAAHLDLYAKAIPRARIRSLRDRDHQLNNDLSEVAADIRALAS